MEFCQTEMISKLEIINYPAPKQKYKVLVRCLTFNHSKYIEDTLNGFAIQKTNFPFACLVVDDASTDGTQDIIKRWMERECDIDKAEIIDIPTSVVIIVPHKTNKSCTFAFYFLKRNMYKAEEDKMQHIAPWREVCEYTASCEGDDFWISTDKLQLQIDFLDEHKDYTMCSHRIYRYDQDSNMYYKDCLDYMFNGRTGCDIRNTMPVWLAETSSVVYRTAADIEYHKYPRMKRDNIRVYFILKQGKGHCLSNVMSVYRQHDGGIFSKQNVNDRLINGSYKAFKELYSYEKTKESQYLYYRSYANTIIQTKGRILFSEEFSLIKFISLLYFIPSLLSIKRPLYTPVSLDK